MVFVDKTKNIYLNKCNLTVWPELNDDSKVIDVYCSNHTASQFYSVS
jgi:hypothetical protein